METKRIVSTMPKTRCEIRAHFTAEQLLRLEDIFQQNTDITCKEINQLAEEMGQSHHQVQTWFHFRRRKEREICKRLKPTSEIEAKPNKLARKSPETVNRVEASSSTSAANSESSDYARTSDVEKGAGTLFRRRQMFSKEERLKLEEIFKQTPNIDRRKAIEVANEMDRSYRQIQKWFYFRRNKEVDAMTKVSKSLNSGGKVEESGNALTEDVSTEDEQGERTTFRSRVRLTDEQHLKLEEAFKQNPHIDLERTKKLGDQTCLTCCQVEKWFKTRLNKELNAVNKIVQSLQSGSEEEILDASKRRGRALCSSLLP
ncbi:unnamed protein product [Clavelina lepadiformis]|uniref:Homeobox domain-containing protein n=1 Tax=Clavelina lepadiformis TaxID=159417 RepID=A0ABP0FMM6_CLALP